MGRSRLWPSKYLPILTGTDNDGSSAVRSDEHPQSGLTGYFVSTEGGLLGTVIQRHLTKTTKKKSSPGPGWPLLCQQKGSSERSLVSLRPRQPELIQLLCGKLFRESCLWSPLWVRCGGRNLQQRGSNEQQGSSRLLKRGSYLWKGTSVPSQHHLCSVNVVRWVRPGSLSHTLHDLAAAVGCCCFYSTKSAPELNSSQQESREKARVLSREESRDINKIFFKNPDCTIWLEAFTKSE